MKILKILSLPYRNLVDKTRPLCKQLSYLLLIGLVPASVTLAESYLPVPEGAKGPMHPLHLTGTLFVEELSNGLYWVTDGVSKTLFKVGKKGVLLVDAPPNLMHPPVGNGLLGMISEMSGGLPVTHLVYSHRHRDHIAGAGEVMEAFPSVKIFAHDNLRRSLKTLDAIEHAADPLPLPQVTVKEGKRLRIKPFGLELVATEGYWHTPGDLMIYAPQEKVLMAVDLVDPGWVPFTGFNFTPHLPGYAQALDQALAFDFEHYIGGHGRLGKRSDIEDIRNFTRDVREAVAQGVATYSLIGPNTPESIYDNVWNLFKHYIETIVSDCVDTVVEKHLHLGGVDSFTASQCRAAMASFFND